MTTFENLGHQKSLEISHKDANDCQITAKHSSLASIFHDFVGLIASYGQVRIGPIAKRTDLLHIPCYVIDPSLGQLVEIDSHQVCIIEEGVLFDFEMTIFSQCHLH